MDQDNGELGSRRPMTLRPRSLARPAYFDPPQLTESRSSRPADEHAKQFARALAEAREEGLQIARAEVGAAVAALEAARRDLEHARRSLLAAVAELTSRDGENLSDIEGRAVRFGFDLAELVIGRELEACSDELELAMRRSIEFAPERGPLELRLNPLDVGLAREVLNRDPAFAARVEVISDAHVERGGCITVVGPLRIDAQLGPAMARIRDLLTE